MSRTTLPTAAGAAALTVALLAGCGGGDQDGGATEGPEGAQQTSAPLPDDVGATSSAPGDDGSGATATASPPPGDAAATTTAGPAGEPASVVVTSQDGAFTLRAPAGWVDVTDAVEQEVEVALRDDEMTSDFYSNVVVTSEEPLTDLEASVEAAAAELAGEDGDFTMLPVIAIGGEDAPGYVVHRVADEVPIAQVQRWVQHGDRLYVLTLSTASEQEAASRAVFDRVVQSWSWTG